MLKFHPWIPTREDLAMVRFLSKVVLLGVGVVALGYYLDWFDVSTSESFSSDQSEINLHIHKGKIKADAWRAKEKISEWKQDFEQMIDES
jgi:hypothetical protein